MNLQQLSYLGDAVFELMIREYAINNKKVKINDLHNFTQEYVTAKKQAYFTKTLIENNKLSKEELEIIRKGRNIKTHKSPKNCDIITYKCSTAFEILIGYLYKNDKNRLEEIFQLIIGM